MLVNIDNIETFVHDEILGINRKAKHELVGSKVWKEEEKFANEILLPKYLPHSLYQGMTDQEMKLREYLDFKGVKIMVSDDLDSEAFVFKNYGYCSIVLMNKDIEEDADERIINLAHEIGHFIDFSLNFNYSYDEYSAAQGVKNGLVEVETIAWAYAKDILVTVGFDDWFTFYDAAVESLASYIDDDYVRAGELISEMDKIKQSRSMIRMMMNH